MDSFSPQSFQLRFICMIISQRVKYHGLLKSMTADHSSPKLRRGIDYIGVGVGALIIDARGRLFLSRRGSQAKNERGLWEFPGGSVEFGEKLAEALQREMREEYGIEVQVGELLDVVDHILPEEGQHWVSPAFLCTITSGEPRILEPGKCAEIGWFAPDEMPPGLTMITRLNWEHYLRKVSPADRET
jgi:mutator protein MutT